MLIIPVACLLWAGKASFTYDKYFEITKNIEIFTNLYKEINTNYVDELDPNKLMKSGIDAMLNQLDPFTNYISEAQIENYRISVEGRYNGVGVRAKKIGDYVTITEVYKDYPAYKAGIKVGDQVLAVNGENAKGKESADLDQIMRGVPNSEVVLTILRPGEKDKRNIKLIRDEVNIPNVPYSGMITENIGYIHLNSFTENAGRNVQLAFKKLKDEQPQMKGLVLDLRDNGGGLLMEAVHVCNTFLPQGQVVVSTRGRFKDRDVHYKTQKSALDEKLPLVVLINSLSASASEIVSGSLQDLDRAVIIGQVSYGKGLVQNTRPVGYNAQVKLTTAKYYISSGRCIQNVKFENGVPLQLPDSLRSPFKTRNGRIVYDGGGIKPDIDVKEAALPEIVNKLIDQALIFQFVTEYCLKNPAPETYKNYNIDVYDRFIGFLRERKFDDNSDVERKIAALEEEILKQDDSRDLVAEVQSLKRRAAETQWTALSKHKELINNIIEEEIALRYHYQEGKLLKKMEHDPVIKEAISVLENEERYKKILSPR